FSPDLVQRIRDDVSEQNGIPGPCVMLCGSHSHSGPTVMSFRSMGDRDPAYEDVLCRKVAGAVKMAADGLDSVSLSAGRAPVRIGYNRREMRQGKTVLGHNPGGPEAPWVDVLRLDRSNGSPIGLLYTTASHPVNLRGLEFSAELPGAAARFIAHNLDGAVAMFGQGCCGDINCSPQDGTFEMTERLGGLLGAAAVSAALSAEPLEGTQLASESRTIQLPLRIPTVGEAEEALRGEQERCERAEHDEDVTPYLLRQYRGQIDWARDYLRAAQEGKPQSQPFEIQVMRIGEMALVAYPGEMFVDYQLTMDRESPFVKTLTLAYSNGCIGYVPTASAFEIGGYEVTMAYRYYGTLMITSECEGLVKQTTLDMLNHLKGAQ
ncbi:MAG: hypothetical protein QGI83_11810, partial [Candidatus Latescibacteria bacterium]|nr:hypothetical protein [Candidatus Latescibacterota bacterium]